MRILLFLLLFFSLPCAADTRPAWVDRTPADTGDDKFYVACGTGDTQAEALKEAEKDAQKRAIIDNFGVKIEYFFISFSTDDDDKATSQSSERMNATLAGFKEKARYFPNANGKKRQACALYAYSKKQIERERRRLENAKDADKQTVGFKSDTSGILDLTTEPVRDAEVAIDGIIMAKNNSFQKFSLENGKHTLTLHHPLYESVTRKFTVLSGEKTTLVVPLSPVKIDITLTTPNDIGAEIWMNGKKAGSAPKTVSIFVDRDNTFTLKHDEYFETTRTFKRGDLTRDDDGRTFSVPMEERTAYAEITTRPAGAEVFIDNERIGLTGEKALKKAVSRGSHDFRIYKSGYVQEDGSFTAEGGKTFAHTFVLKKDKSFKNMSLTVLDDPASAPAANKDKAPAPRKEQETPLVDKAHDFTFTPLPVSSPVIPNEATVSDYITALMRWDYPDNFLQAAVSFKKTGNAVTLYPRVFFNPERYKDKFADNMDLLTERLNLDKSRKKMTFHCRKETNLPNKKCSYSVKDDSYDYSYDYDTGKYDSSYRKVYIVKTERRFYDAVWIPETVLYDRDKGTIKTGVYKYASGKKLSLKKRPPASYALRLKIDVKLKNGQTATRYLPLSIGKFSAGDNYVRFVPLINGGIRPYVAPVRLSDVSPENIRSVSLSFVKG